MPAAHAASNANLFVSAENSQWNNYFAGPQVIQVVVADPDINRLDQAYGEPVVTINGKRLRMAQGTDGNWYAYFADRNQAIAASKTSGVNGTGLNFGLFCGPNSALVGKTGVNYADTKGFTIARDYLAGAFGAQLAKQLTSSDLTNVNCKSVTTGTTTSTQVGAFTSGAQQSITRAGLSSPVTTIEHVVRQNKTLNTNALGFNAGGTYETIWPVVQLYDFGGTSIPTAVTVDYQKNGGDQIVNLTFDRIPQNLISVTTDRATYPMNSQVFLTMNDPQLNIDPTEDDSWTWGASATNSTLYYEAFTRNGAVDADGVVVGTTPAMQSIIGNLTTLMFNHNGKLTINPAGQTARVIDFQSNGKQILNGSSTTRGDPTMQKTASISAGSEPITFIESGGVNTGVFGNWDGSKKSTIVTVNNQNIRGQSATFRYNDIGGNIVGGFNFGTITETPVNNTWASGQRLPVTLTDNDQNRNSKLTEHLNDYDGSIDRLTAMKIGTPFSLTSGQPSLNTLALDPSVFHGTQGTITTLANGSRTISFSGIRNGTDPDIAQDESFSNRAVPTFVNNTSVGGAFPNVRINNGGHVIVDTLATMQTLLNTINDPRGSTGATRFHGFNFLNYDLRGFSSLNGANGTDPSGVQVFIVYDTPNHLFSVTTGAGTSATSFVNPQTGVVTATAKYISIANSTSLIDFINLNGTVALPGDNNHGSFYTPGASTHSPKIANGTLVMSRIMAIPTNANVGLMFQFNTTGTSLPLATSTSTQAVSKGIPIVGDFFSIGYKGDGLTSAQRVTTAFTDLSLKRPVTTLVYSRALTNMLCSTSSTS
jgi:hypothetical protein